MQQCSCRTVHECLQHSTDYHNGNDLLELMHAKLVYHCIYSKRLSTTKQRRRVIITALCFLLPMHHFILGTSKTLAGLPSLDVCLMSGRLALPLDPCLSPSQDALTFRIFLCTFSQPSSFGLTPPLPLSEASAVLDTYTLLPASGLLAAASVPNASSLCIWRLSATSLEQEAPAVKLPQPAPMWEEPSPDPND